MKTQAQQNYAAERLDPRWQKKRLEIMQRDAFKCTDCCDEKSTLNVHHRYYVKNREVWDYPSFALVTLCAACHSTAHIKRADDFPMTTTHNHTAPPRPRMSRREIALATGAGMR